MTQWLPIKERNYSQLYLEYKKRQSVSLAFYWEGSTSDLKIIGRLYFPKSQLFWALKGSVAVQNANQIHFDWKMAKSNF